MGSGGTYALHAEAYRRAAAKRGVLPREMQSITWEAVRGLFPDTFKNPKNKRIIDTLWQQYDNGSKTIEQTREAIFKLAGGIDKPLWLD